MTFDPDWPHGHVTADGRKARIICKDYKGENGETLLAIVTKESGKECVYEYYDNGHFMARDTNHKLDLLDAPAPKRKFERWVNICENGDTYVHSSEDDANPGAVYGRPVAARYHFVVEEGEGLE